VGLLSTGLLTWSWLAIRREGAENDSRLNLASPFTNKSQWLLLLARTEKCEKCGRYYQRRNEQNSELSRLEQICCVESQLRTRNNIHCIGVYLVPLFISHVPVLAHQSKPWAYIKLTKKTFSKGVILFYIVIEE